MLSNIFFYLIVKMFTLRIVLLLFSSFLTINAYININLKNPTTKYGFVYPNRAEPDSNVTYVHEGVDVLIYLAKTPDNNGECDITTPDASIRYSLLVNGNENSKVAFWIPNSRKTGCGARIKNVTVSDSGRWRLRAVSEENDHLYQSFLHLKVIKNFVREDGDFIIREGPFDEFNMTKYASYCEISDPVLKGDIKIFDKCQVDLVNINKLYATKWKANVGVLGKIDEIILQPNVDVLGENFDVGFNKTENPKKINLFCNLKNAVNTNVTFCRFIKDGEEYGLRLSEGLSNGNYSYFGRKLKDGDCGLTIENPKPKDYGVWKCSLGIYRQINATEIIYEVKESIISIPQKNNKKRSLRSADIEIETMPEILAALENPLVLSHKADFPIKYCIIKHPNGTQYAINEPFRNEHWVTRGDINIGKCDMTIFNTTVNETGLWQMQIGHIQPQFMDKIVNLPVRVGKKAMIAVNESIIVEQDSQLTLKCRAVADDPNIIEYCRFTLPDGSGFQINKHVTEDVAINGLYWYNGTSLEKGDCQVTIKEVNSAHYGKWSCSGKIQGSNSLEDFDYITVESGQLSIASISGIAVGAAAVLVISVGGLIYYRKKKRQQPERRQTYLSSSSRSTHSDVPVFERDLPLVSAESGQAQEVDVEEIEMSNISQTQSRPSTSAQSRPQSRVSGSAQSVASARSNPSVSAQSRPSTSAPLAQEENTEF